MKKIRGTFLSIPVLLLANAPALWKLIDINSLLKTLIIILFALYTLVFMFRSHGRKGSHGKIRRLDSGAFVLGCGVLQSVIQLIIVIVLYKAERLAASCKFTLRLCYNNAFVSEWHCADSGFGTSGENTVVCYFVIHLVHTTCELHRVQKILQGSEK